MTTIRPRINRPLLTLLVTVLMSSSCLALLAIGASANARPYTATTASAAAKASRALSAAAQTRTLADHALVSNARQLKRCLRTPHAHCTAARRAVQQSGIRLTQAESHLSKLAQGEPSVGRISAVTGAPRLSVSWLSLTWTRVHRVKTYILARKVPGQADHYSVVDGTSIVPLSVPGVTVAYSVRTNVSGSAWSTEQSIPYPATKTAAPTPTPPTSTGGEGGTTPPVITPPVTTPPVTTPPLTTTPPSSGSETGTSGAPFEMALVPGSLASTEPGTIHQLGAHSVRMGYPIETPASQLAGVMEEYAKVGIRIVPLATFTGKVPTSAQAANLASWAAAYGPGGTFWQGKSFPADTAMTDIEFGNETSYTYQFSDNSEEAIAERAQSYALRFKEAEESIHAVAPDVGLLAQGDNGETDGSTWVDNMFKAVPNLAQLVAGWTIHPYGTESVRRINEMIAQTQAAGAPSTIPIYVTEWGLSTDNGRCLSENYGWNPCMNYEEAATDLATSVTTMHEHFGGRLRAVYLYQAQDLASSGSSTNREEYFGALQQDGARKGAYTTEVEALLHANP